jgi:hypothetical protein
VKKPLVFDLFCGLGGWSSAFISEGYRAVGFDIEAHDYGNGGYPGDLVLRDVRSICGADLVKQYGIPACIVASPPCQEFSYMAMPWTKAKKKEQEILSDPKEQVRLTDLFNQCFRIQREVSEAAQRYVPIIIENVRGAQKWVGKARWNFGSFYLWGDIPALMPIPGKTAKVPGFRFDGSGQSFQTASVNKCEGAKTSGMNWSDRSKRGQDFTRVAGIQSDGVKGFTPHGQPLGKNELGRRYGSKSRKRKEASAIIAKIPLPLAQWIARVYKTPIGERIEQVEGVV